MEPITTMPKAPETGLIIETKLTVGKNQVQRHLQLFRSLYLDGNFISREVKLAPGQALTIGDKWKGGVIATKAPLDVEFYSSDEYGGFLTRVTTRIQKLLSIDGEYDRVVLTAPADGETVSVTLFYIG
jgi:hypothetical protein